MTDAGPATPALMPSRRGLFVEDLHTGQEFTTPARTLTEADLSLFCGLSGDFNPLHTDETFARSTLFGRRVLHGVLGMAVMTGLLERTGVFEGTALASLSVRNWIFERPLFVGDTVHASMTIGTVRLVSAGDRGVVERLLELRDASGAVLQRGVMDLLVAARSAVRPDQ